MILLDFSQIFLSNFSVSFSKNEEIEEDMLRHMILNSVRNIHKKFSGEFGELVICCDGSNIWRKKVFPYYKANRKKMRDASSLDWKKIYEILDKVREEIKEFLPYRLIRIDGAEGDDVIAVLASEWSNELINNNNKILIVSGDKDFTQMQRYPNVKQYDPVNKKMIVTKAPDKALKEHIIRGDVGDGVPNFLSNDDCLVLGVRQKPIYTDKLLDWIDKPIEEFCDENMLRNYKRNESLIDLSKVPAEIKSNILAEFQSEAGKNRSKIMKYFVEKRLSRLMDIISDF